MSVWVAWRFTQDTDLTFVWLVLNSLTSHTHKQASERSRRATDGFMGLSNPRLVPPVAVHVRQSCGARLLRVRAMCGKRQV